MIWEKNRSDAKRVHADLFYLHQRDDLEFSDKEKNRQRFLLMACKMNNNNDNNKSAPTHFPS